MTSPLSRIPATSSPHKLFTNVLRNFSSETSGTDPFKGVDWKAVGGEMQQNPNVQPNVTKRLPKKVRQIPDFYFLPRWSRSSALLFCSACIAGGVGAGMLVEAWINKKVKEDGGVIWEFDK